MTVQELIKFLENQRKDLPVVFKMMSDYSELLEEDIKILNAEDKKVLFRNGNYCRPYAYIQFSEGEKPNYVTVLCLPGN
jgi:hypothetical protein